MPIPLIAAAAGIGLARAGLGAAQAITGAKKQKRLIRDAYGRGRERLDTNQGDARQSMGEGIIARGLAVGGGVRDLGAVAPGAPVDVTQARTLGAAQMLEQRREQGIAQTDLRTERDNALQDTSSARTQGIIGSLFSGAQTAMDVYSGGKALQTMRGMGSAAGSYRPADPRPWGNIDPVDPLGRGAWAEGAGTVGEFNIFTGSRREGMY